MPKTQLYIKKPAQFDRAILRQAPYRGIQKEVAEELNMGAVTVHRAIKKGDVVVMGLILKKMLEINRTIDTIKSIESQLKVHFEKAARGALEIDMITKPNKAKWSKVKKRKKSA